MPPVSKSALARRADREARKQRSAAAPSHNDEGKAAGPLSALERQLEALQIKATCQETRFHADTTVTATREIDMHSLSIHAGLREIVGGDTRLRLKDGVKYGLVGRNGTGKSTLLLALAHRLIPGLPDSVRITLVSQLESSALLNTVAQADSAKAAHTDVPSGDRQSGSSKHRDNSGLSVLDAALQGDQRMIAAQQEHALLTAAIESSDPQQVKEATCRVRLERSAEHLQESRKRVLRRSGARGKAARIELIEAEREHEEAKERAERNGPPSKPLETETTNLQDTDSEHDWEAEAVRLQGQALEILVATEAETAVPRAHAILRGLGFSEAMISQPYATLSGGWRSRVSLAAALLKPMDVLLLDEPTNFLDLPSVLWLEGFIHAARCTVVTVAHDVDFFNAVTQELIVLSNKSLEYFDGNLREYERTKRRKRKMALRQQMALDRSRAHIEKSIAQGKKEANKTGDENKQRMVKSREKKLNDRWGLETNAAGHRFKLNRDLQGYFFTSRQAISLDNVDASYQFRFPSPDTDVLKGALVHLENISFSYNKKAAKPLLSGVNMTIHPGDRIGLVGPNGQGKSTLLGLLSGALHPLSGHREEHPRLRIGHFCQDAVENLVKGIDSERPATSKDTMTSITLASRGPNKQNNGTALEHFQEHCGSDLFRHQANEGKARGFLAQFGLSGRSVDTIPYHRLSGGQRGKLVLAEVTASAPPLLILDEVTSALQWLSDCVILTMLVLACQLTEEDILFPLLSAHMDHESIDALVAGLKDYSGAIVLVSHDRHAVHALVETDQTVVSDDSDSDDGEQGNMQASTLAAAKSQEEEVRRFRGTYLVTKGRARRLAGGVSDYVQRTQKKLQSSVGGNQTSHSDHIAGKENPKLLGLRPRDKELN